MCQFQIMPAYEENNVPIVVEFDNFYVPYAAVCIQSIIETASQKKNYDIIILSHSISESNKYILQSLSEDSNNISIRVFNANLFKESISNQIQGKIQIEDDFWVRNLSPYIFPRYKKIIVIDLDVLVQHDLADLLEISMGEYCLAGVRDLIWCGQYVENYPWQKNGKLLGITMREYCETVLPLRTPLNYYNSGLTIWNCVNCRNQVSELAVIENISNKKFFLSHQDAINLVFEDRIKFIETKWNYQVQVNGRYAQRMSNAPEEYKKEYELGKQNPYVIHWLGNPKPYVCPDVELGYLWWETAKRTPFIPHIFARMFDELTKRQEYYEKRYGTKVKTWDPTPKNINRK